MRSRQRQSNGSPIPPACGHCGFKPRLPKTYEELLEATPSHVRKDAEVASALCRRALAGGLLDRAIEHAKDATADKPKWSQAHLLLAQAYFGAVAMAVRTITPLRAEEKEASLANSLAAADDAISIAVTEGDSIQRRRRLRSSQTLLSSRGEKKMRRALPANHSPPIRPTFKDG